MVDELDRDFDKLSRIIPLILIVDDNHDNLLFLSYILDNLNLKFVSATTSGDAISLAINKQPDLIFLDMVMPMLDGMEITRRLKQHSFTKDIPIVAVTGLTLPKHKQAIEEAGCDAYVCKPFLIEEIEDKIARFLKLCLI